MAQKKAYGTGNGYIEGTVVRRQEVEIPVPGRQNERRRRAQEQKREQALIREGKEKAREFSYLYLAGFVAVCAAAFVLLGIFVHGEASLYNHSRNVSNLQSQYEELVENNNATEARLEASIDLDYIYSVATEQLGMSYPSEGQIIDYINEEREHVRKYESIPNE